MKFDGRSLTLGGGVDINNETITFIDPHNLFDGQHIIYNQNGHNPISIGVFGDATQSITGTLVSGDEYVAKFVNTSSIKLFKLMRMQQQELIQSDFLLQPLQVEFTSLELSQEKI